MRPHHQRQRRGDARHGALAGLRSGIAYLRADSVLWSLLAALGVEVPPIGGPGYDELAELGVRAAAALARRAKAGEADYFHGAPYHTPRRRLDETLAARQPVLRWKPEETKKAAE